MGTSARTAHRALVGGLAVVALASTIPLSGCGSGSKGSLPNVSGTTSRKKGSLTFNIVWPEQTRVIPQAANSIKLTLVRTPDTTIPAPAPVTPVVLTINRPATSAQFDNLELGDYTITAEAYPVAGGTGTVQARAVVTRTVAAGVNPALSMTMNATVATVEIGAKPPFDATLNSLKRVNDVVELIATAKDAAGNIVLTQAGPTSTLIWSIVSQTPSGADPAVVALDVPTGKVTVVGLGSATIQARYIEPGVTPGAQGTGAAATYTLNSTATGLSTDAWAKLHGDIANTGQAITGASVTTATFAPGSWPFQTFSSIVFASPAVTNPATSGPDAGKSTIYVGAQDGFLYALRSDGTQKWRFQTGGAIDSSPTISKNGTIFFGSSDGKVYAIKDSGTQADLVWSFDAEGPVVASPTLSSNGVLYFGTVNNDTTKKATFFAVDSLTGKELWFYTDSNLPQGQSDGVQTTATLSADEKTVFFGSLNGFVYALWTGKDAGDPQPQPTVPSEARQGIKAQRRWRSAQFGSLFISSPVLGTTGANGLTLYIGSLDGHAYALNANSGGTIWSYDAGAPIYSTVALKAGGGVLYVATLDNVSGTNDSKVAAVRADTGGEIWRTASGVFSDGFSSSPAISSAGDVLYIGNFNGKIYGINATVDLTNPTNPLPTAQSGSVVWTLTTPPPTAGQPDNNIESSPAIGADGTVYLGGFSGEVYAIK